MKRVVFAISLVALISLLILGLGGLGRASAIAAAPSGRAGAEAWKPDPNPTVCVEASSTPGGAVGSRRDPAPIGQTVPVTTPIGGANTECDVTITEVVTGQEALNRLQQANQFNQPPAEGEEYVLFFSRAHITKTSGERAVSVTQFDWSLVNSTGRIFTPAIVVVPEPQFTGSGFEGATIEGWSTFTRKVGEQVSLVFGLERLGGTGGAWFAVSGQ